MSTTAVLPAPSVSGSADVQCPDVARQRRINVILASCRDSLVRMRDDRQPVLVVFVRRWSWKSWWNVIT